MEKNTEAQLLRIFVSSTDKFKHTPLYDLPYFDKIRYGGMITLEKAIIVLHKQGTKKNY